MPYDFPTIIIIFYLLIVQVNSNGYLQSIVLSRFHEQIRQCTPSLNQTPLTSILLQKLKNLMTYNFHSKLTSQIPHISSKYLYTPQIFIDIQAMLEIAQGDPSTKNEQPQSIEQALKETNFIIQDQLFKNRLLKNNTPTDDHSITKSSHNGNAQHEKNLNDNQSLVCQINLIYKSQFDKTQYNRALKLFLKWNSIFQRHYQQKFLKPLYQQFIKSIYQIDINEFQHIVQQIVAFVQYMVEVYTQIYQLKKLHESQDGNLFKKQNVFNLVMSNIFLINQINKLVRSSIKIKQQNKIKIFSQKLLQFKGKSIQTFKVQPKFRLSSPLETINQSHDQSNDCIKVNQTEKQSLVTTPEPYNSCFKPIENLSENSQTPITKLKLIIQVSKGIASSIYTHYQQIHSKEVPELDPQNLTCILMYLIVRVNNVKLLEQLKIAQHFTTTNCLNCISGYYLHTMNAAIETLLTF